LAQQRLPWVSLAAIYPERVEANLFQGDLESRFNPYRVENIYLPAQGSGYAATLGYMIATLSGLL
jgi:hypothetical protein